MRLFETGIGSGNTGAGLYLRSLVIGHDKKQVHPLRQLHIVIASEIVRKFLKTLLFLRFRRF